MAKNTGLGLGRGLGALIDTDSVTTGGSSSISDVEISLIDPNPNQPRTIFDEDTLTELATSISELGIISPITLRVNDNGRYMIIAGERRYRASQMIGLSTIPAYIRTAADDNVLEMALIENIQREDLNAIEIALSYQKLLDEHRITQERLSERVGKNRATIANYLRLLRLPAEIQMAIKDRKIEMGHARTLLGINDPAAQLHLYKAILSNNYSVRKIEEFVKRFVETGSFDETEQKMPKTTNDNSPGYDDVRHKLKNIFNAKVQLKCNQEGKGKITIPFADDMELGRIMELLDKIE